MALLNLGITTLISDISIEQSTESQVLNAFYQTARDATLRAVPWRFAGVVGFPLVLATDFTQIAGTRSQWCYSYRYPANCLHVLRVASLRRQDSRQSRVPFQLSSDSQGQIIYTNMPRALADFTTQFTNAEAFPADFSLAFSFLLSALSARGLTGGDPFKLGPQMEAKYEKAITAAAVANLNEEQVEQDAQSEFITARSEGSVDPESQGVPWYATNASNPIE